jgi:hypothetical protein
MFTTAVAVIIGIVIILAVIFAGIWWLKPEYLKVIAKWNHLEVEMKQPTKALPKRAKGS